MRWLINASDSGRRDDWSHRGCATAAHAMIAPCYPAPMSRLPLVAAMIAALIFASGCGPATRADATDISGVMPPLTFSIVRANDSARVDAQDYRSKTVLL